MDGLKAFRDSGKITEVTFQILVKLKRHKEKKEKYKSIRFVSMLILLIVCAITLYYLYSGALQSTFFLKVAFSLVVAWLFWKLSNEKYEEKKDEYEVLRKEVIARGGDLGFYHMDQDEYAEILEYMHKKLDINLYHIKK